MGKDCPHVREKGSMKQNKVCIARWAIFPICPCSSAAACSVLTAFPLPQDLCELAFSVSYDHGEEEAYLNFIAPTKREVSSQVEPMGGGMPRRAPHHSSDPAPSSTCGQMD